MWSRIPLVRLIIPFIAGIITAEYFPSEPALFMWVSSIMVLGGGIFYGLLFGYGTRYIYGIFIILFMFLTACNFLVRKQKSGSTAISTIPFKESIFLFKTTGPFEAREKTFRVSGHLEGLRDSLKWLHTEGDLIIYAEPDSLLLDVKPGSYLVICIKPDTVPPPANPSQFNYKKYLSRKGVYHTAYLDKGKWQPISNKRAAGISVMATNLRKELLDKLEAHGIRERNFGISSALLLGDDTHIAGDVRDIYARAGAMHILCVSGLHVGVVFLVLGFVFSFMKRTLPGRILLPLILMLSIWAYALVTGLAPPVVRASCMISFFIIGDSLKRNKNAYNTLAASAMLMLLLDPELLFAAGFQLSYSAVLGILSLQKPIYNLLYVKPYLPDKVWSITAVSIAAQLGTLPVVLYYFHQFPLYSLLTNLIVIPLSSLIIYAGMLFFVLPSHTLLTEGASWVLNMLVTVMDRGVALVDSLPYGMVEDLHTDLIKAILLALIIILISIALIDKKKSALILAICVMLGYSLYRVHLNHKALNQQAFIVYAIRGHSAYDIIRGKDHTFCADSTLLESDEKIGYSVAPNWLTMYLNEPRTQMLNAKRYTLQGIRKKILVWNKQLPKDTLSNRLKLDYLILRAHCRFDLADLFNFFDPEKVIIDSSVPPWIEVPEEDLRYWDVREKGAFVSSGFRVQSAECE